MEKISKYLYLGDATKSYTAKKLGIKNEPLDWQLINIKNVATNIYDKVLDYLKMVYGTNAKLDVASFFRSPQLNKAIGGAFKIINGKYVATSQHTRGEAIDLDTDTYKIGTNKEIFNYIKDNLEFDQMIWEYGDNENPDWIHVSLKSDRPNRKQLLIAKLDSRNKTYYTAYGTHS